MTNTTKTVAIVALAVLLSVVIIYFTTRHEDTSGIRLKCFQTASGWGYSVSIHGKQYIYQQFIPVVQAQKSFPTEESAEKIGQLVVERLKHNEPPVITSADLKQAGLLK